MATFGCQGMQISRDVIAACFKTSRVYIHRRRAVRVVSADMKGLHDMKYSVFVDIRAKYLKSEPPYGDSVPNFRHVARVKTSN